MRILTIASLALGLGAALAGLTGTPAAAARYAVVCIAPGAQACRTACSSNTYTVACYAVVRNGRCFKSCGRVR
jgi:hypothetical protein